MGWLRHRGYAADLCELRMWPRFSNWSHHLNYSLIADGAARSSRQRVPRAGFSPPPRLEARGGPSSPLFLGLNLPPFPAAVRLGELDAVRPPSSWHAALHVDAASPRLGASLPGLLPPSSAAAFSPAVKIAGWLRGKVNCILDGLRAGKSCPQRGGWICCAGGSGGPARQSRTTWSIETGSAAGGSWHAVKGGSCCSPHGTSRGPISISSAPAGATPVPMSPGVSAWRDAASQHRCCAGASPRRGRDGAALRWGRAEAPLQWGRARAPL